MSVKVKICGLSTPETLTAAIEGGADYVGFVFHPGSPRHLEIEVAAYLAGYVPARVKIVGLFVDADDRRLDQTLSAVRLDMLQLHGQENAERIAQLRRRFDRPVMKSVSVATADDLIRAAEAADAADWLLLDAKGTEAMPGGNGLAFDWALLEGFSSARPWMLAGGLTPGNVGEAIRRVDPDGVDVSSGVEANRGIKDPEKIRAFIAAARAAGQHSSQ